MKKLLLISLLLTTGLFASLRVDTTYSTLGAITQAVGGDLVDVTVLGSSKYDPHFIVPKPSLLSKLRRADLLIINGGGLELGWLPPLIQNAHNPYIVNGAKGFLDISHYIPMIDKPVAVSRAFGDVHAQGNPHYLMDPHLVLTVAKAITQKLEQLDPENMATYKNNLDIFSKKWHKYLAEYDANLTICKAKKIVQYHELYNYFLNRYNLTSIATIEPLPGIAPSSKHTLELIMLMKKNHIKTILQDVYHEKKTAEFLAEKTGANIAVVPHDVGSVKGSATLESFYKTIAKQICQ